jgi:hypothetical protein
MAEPAFDNLSGRELDAAVAAQLFGLVAEPRVNTRTRERDAVYRLPNGDWVRVAFYSERMGPCLNVEAWLREQGWERIAPTGKAPAGEVEVVYQHKDGRTLGARGRLNEAVCRAALKAMGSSGIA